MVLEGTYPYVAGGVSTWTHDIIRGLPQYQFHVLCLMPPGADRTMRYELPDNVCGVTAVTLQQLEPKAARVKGQKQLLENLRTPLDSIIAGGGIVALQEIMALLEPQREQLGQQVLLDSPEAWKLLVNMYQATYGDTSFLDYFLVVASTDGRFVQPAISTIAKSADVSHSFNWLCWPVCGAR